MKKGAFAPLQKHSCLTCHGKPVPLGGLQLGHFDRSSPEHGHDPPPLQDPLKAPRRTRIQGKP